MSVSMGMWIWLAAMGVARQKTPEFVAFVDEFPRTAAGKAKKQILRTQIDFRGGTT